MSVNKYFTAIDECEAAILNANRLIKMSDAVLNTGREIAPDNTEQMMENTNIREGEDMGDIRELLEEIQNDNISPDSVKKLAKSTAKFLKEFDDEVSYDDAMEILKK